MAFDAGFKRSVDHLSNQYGRELQPNFTGSAQEFEERMRTQG